jgi:hypothetical protein
MTMSEYNIKTCPKHKWQDWDRACPWCEDERKNDVTSSPLESVVQPQQDSGVPLNPDVQPAAHIERVARRAWEDFCRFRDVGGRISAVAKFPGYAVRISIKEVAD